MGRETVDDEHRDERATATTDALECEVCGSRVPAAVYREHLLKACPGEGESGG